MALEYLSEEGADYGETQIALLVNAIMLVMVFAIISWVANTSQINCCLPKFFTGTVIVDTATCPDIVAQQGLMLHSGLLIGAPPAVENCALICVPTYSSIGLAGHKDSGGS